MCAHCSHTTVEQKTIGPPVTAPRFNPDELLLWLDYPSGLWCTLKPEPVICDHGKPDGSMLCPVCEERLWRALADVPRLVADLELHLTKQNVFLERGMPQPSEDEEEAEVVDESPLPYVEAASSTLRDLTRVLGERPAREAINRLYAWRDTLRLPHLAEFASRLTRATTKAFRVIDMNPYLTHYGTCPTCKTDIRIERVPEEDDVVCPGCGYKAKVADHLRAQLDLAADRQFTLTDVVKVLNDAGEPTTRQEVENLIYRQGLPREQVPVWQDGRLEKVWKYRLGDVRDWLNRHRRKRRSA
jgi:uncharacterized Zn finger protein (UPF0148 family)